jgi:hypothetical protein
VAFATVAAAIAYPAFAVIGVIDLASGKIAPGLILLACVAYGIPTFMRWRRRFHESNR